MEASLRLTSLTRPGKEELSMKLYQTEEETTATRRNEIPRVPSINHCIDNLQSRHFVNSFGALDLTEDNMNFLFDIVEDSNRGRFVSGSDVSPHSNVSIVVLCEFFNTGGRNGTFCYGVPGKEISLEEFKDYAPPVEESYRYYFLVEVKNAPKGSNICLKEIKNDNELVPFCKDKIIAIVKPE